MPITVTIILLFISSSNLHLLLVSNLKLVNFLPFLFHIQALSLLLIII